MSAFHLNTNKDPTLGGIILAVEILFGIFILKVLQDNFIIGTGLEALWTFIFICLVIAISFTLYLKWNYKLEYSP